MDPIVLDHGSAFIKAGYANPDNEPSVILPSYFCAAPPQLAGQGAWEDVAVPQLQDCIQAIEGGRIMDWEVMEDIWQYILYDQLGWEEGNEGPVLVCEPVLTPKAQRECMAQCMFETFNVSGFFAMEAPVLSLYSLGRVSGCVLDCGHSKIDVAAVSDGALLSSSVCHWDAGGWDLEILLGQLLGRTNPGHARLLMSAEGQGPTEKQNVLRRVKEQVCVTAESREAYEARVGKEPAQEFLLPDGQVLQIAGEGLTVGEALFRPEIVGQQQSGVVEMLLQTVADAALSLGGGQESDRVRSLLDHVAVVGGVSRMQGFSARILNELEAATHPSMHPSLIKPPEYMPEQTAQFAAWIGGAIVAKVAFTQNQFVSRGDYDEKGPSAVHRKLV